MPARFSFSYHFLFFSGRLKYKRTRISISRPGTEPGLRFSGAGHLVRSRVHHPVHAFNNVSSVLAAHLSNVDAVPARSQLIRRRPSSSSTSAATWITRNFANTKIRDPGSKFAGLLREKSGFSFTLKIRVSSIQPFDLVPSKARVAYVQPRSVIRKSATWRHQRRARTQSRG